MGHFAKKRRYATESHWPTKSDLTWDTVSGVNDSGQYFDLTTEEMSKDHEREREGIALMAPLAD